MLTEDVAEVDVVTLFVSDLHISDLKSKHKEFLAFLKSRNDIDKIVLVGDVLDLWVATLDKALSEALPLFSYLAENYTGKVHYLIGNHDQPLGLLKGILPFIHTSLSFPIGNKRGICLHGNILDPNPYVRTKFSHYMAWFINKFDKWARIDTRKSLVSMADRIKNDPYDKILEEYENNIFSVFSGKYDYVIIGHSHQPSLKVLHDLVIINVGDSLQHSTALIARDGMFVLMDYITNKVIATHKVPKE